ncbi:MAG TPA: hypothetical protein VFG14_00900 [Chthoniobacteraceae bacterium]|nr:hypothetical protein [Chthoniobacteraceae bacterium]
MNPSAPNGPRKRKTSKPAKPSKATKAGKAAASSKFPKKGKVVEALVTPDDMERVQEMLRDKMLLDWLDQCAGEIVLAKGKVSLHFGGAHPARSVLANAALTLRHLVFEAGKKSK